MAESVAGDTMPPPSGAVSPAARSQLEAIRDEWLQPLIDQIRDAERTIGRLEAERDQAAQERDALRAEFTAAHVTREGAPQDAIPVPPRGEAGSWVWEAIRDVQEPERPWWRRLLGR